MKKGMGVPEGVGVGMGWGSMGVGREGCLSLCLRDKLMDTGQMCGTAVLCM